MKAPKPGLWRPLQVTVCISALADHEEEIILVTDSKVSFGDFSADRAVMKDVPFVPNWTLLLAGNDIQNAGPIIRRARHECIRRVLEDADEIADVLHAECRREWDRLVECKAFGPPLPFTAKSFKSSGKRLCSDAVYHDLYARSQRISLSLKFLLCGFDAKGKGHIRCVEAKSPPQDFDLLGFYAIGTGANAALSSLCDAIERLHMTRDSDGAAVAYHCLAAKFMAESASDVGNKDTWLGSMKRGQDMRYITPLYGMDYVRKMWERRGAPRIPSEATTTISDLLMTFRESLTREGIAKAVRYSPQKLKALRGTKGIMQSVPQKSASAK